MQIPNPNLNPLEDRVSYFETPVYEIAKALKKKGYEIGHSCGEVCREPAKHAVGILEPRTVYKSFLGIKWTKRERPIFLGVLWVDWEPIGATPNGQWILDVYGRKNVPKLKSIVERLSANRNVAVQIRLESEEPKQGYY